MSFRSSIVFGIVALTVFAFSATLVAQDESPATTEAKAENSVDETIAVDELELNLKPLTVEELEAEADAWIGTLKKASKTHSDAVIAAGGDAMDPAVKSAAVARDALAERVSVVVAALKKKGGEVEKYEAYVEVVTTDAIVGGLTAFFSNLPITVWEWLKNPNGGLLWLKNIVLFLGTLFVFKIIASMLAKITRKAVDKLGKGSALLRDFFVNTVRRVTFFIGFVFALTWLGVDIGPFLAAIGVIGFVVGFALQETLSNFASGVMILIYRPFDVGDAVSVAGVAGGVESMNLVSTTIKSWDNQRVVVPNGKIWGDVITNITGNDTRRVDMVFGIGYDDDIAKAEGILKEIIANTDLVLANPEPVIKVNELADSSVNFIVRPWAKTSDYWAVYWDVTRAVKERFDAESVSIPYPQQDVHMHQVS